MLLIAFFICSISSLFAIRIGSFNLHQYGKAKAGNKTTTNYIASIINTFDLAIIQEISDVSLSAPFVLLDAINAIAAPKTYTMSLSERLGDSNTKEQYAFINRESTSGVQLVSAYVFHDTADYYERPPYVATYKVKSRKQSGVDYFTIINMHLRPDDAYLEMTHLRKVIDEFIKKNPQYFTGINAVQQNVVEPTATNKPHLKTKHPIILVGDMNADCTYISAKKQQDLRNIHFADFTWMINNEVKTNTRQSCTYDRILINGDNFVKAIVPKSNSTMRYDQIFNMSLTQALAISDHFPVQFDINW